MSRRFDAQIKHVRHDRDIVHQHFASMIMPPITDVTMHNTETPAA